MTFGPFTVICAYRVKPGQEVAFGELLAQHWPTLHAAGLATDAPPLIFRAGEGGTVVVEIFSWSSHEAPQRAHAQPAVLQVWGPMSELVEGRDGRPGMEFLPAAPFHPPA